MHDVFAASTGVALVGGAGTGKSTVLRVVSDVVRRRGARQARDPAAEVLARLHAGLGGTPGDAAPKMLRKPPADAAAVRMTVLSPASLDLESIFGHFHPLRREW
ncbi:MAG: hypothetical protein AAFU61_18190, partial [Pseudomonadota bacterium]